MNRMLKRLIIVFVVLFLLRIFCSGEPVTMELQGHGIASWKAGQYYIEYESEMFEVSYIEYIVILVTTWLFKMNSLIVAPLWIGALLIRNGATIQLRRLGIGTQEFRDMFGDETKDVTWF